MVQVWRFDKRKALAPLIANMVLIAITAGGGVVTYGFVQEVIAETELSSKIHIESVAILGHDFRDLTELRSHNGIYMKDDTAGIADGLKSSSERVTIYVKNYSVEDIQINERRFIGDVYGFSGSANHLSTFATNDFPQAGEYVLLSTTPDILVVNDLPILYPGKLASIVIGLDDSVKIGRNAMLKITTTNGFVIVKNMAIGSFYDLHGVKCEAKDEEGGGVGNPEACAELGAGGDSDSEGGSASNSGSEGNSETGGSTGSNTSGGSSGSGSSGGSSGGMGPGSGSSGPEASSSG